MDYYQINHARVIFEVLNSEVIVVNFNTGDYFSLMHSAKYIWQLLDKRIAPTHIVDLLNNQFQHDPASLSADLEQFIQTLLAEELLIKTSDEPVQLLATELGDLIEGLACDNTYLAPIVHKYSDVQNLLKIDPVHDVTEAGWPNMPTAFEHSA